MQEFEGSGLSGSYFEGRGDLALRVNRRYNLLSLVGHGGMGRVYRVEDSLRPGVPLIMKVKGGDNQDLDGEGLQREFLTLSQLAHPSLPRAYDFAWVENLEGEGDEVAPPPLHQPFMIRDYIEGLPLLEASAGFELIDKINLLYQVSLALTYLHNQGLLYRDISSDNILVKGPTGSVGPQVFLMDMGLVMGIGAEGPRSGTAKYLAPEVLRGDPATLRSEVYAFGVLAYECLAGAHPFPEAKDTVSLVRAHLAKAVAPLLTLPPSLTNLLNVLLDKEPERRPADLRQAGEVFAEALSALDQRVPRLLGVGEPLVKGRVALRHSLTKQLLAREGLDAKGALFWPQEWRRGAGLADEGAGPELATEREVVFLTGPAGAGRFPTLKELESRALVLGYRVYRTQARALSQGRHQEPGWMGFLRQILGNRRSQKRTPYLRLLEGILLRWHTMSASDELMREQAWRRLKLGAEALLVEEAEHGPLLLIFDDLHLADPDTLGLFERLVSHLKRDRILLVGSCWPPGPTAPGVLALQERLAGIDLVSWKNLEGLGVGEVAALAKAILGERPEPTLAEALRVHTDGNPLFCIELLRAAGDLEGVQELMDSGLLPGAMEDAGRAQIARLDAVSRGVLEGLGVFARPSSAEELAELLEWDLDKTSDALRRMSLSSLVRSEGDQFVLANGLLAQICVDLPSPERGAALHLRAAEMGADCPADPLPLQVQARHWRLAGRLDRALEDLWQGARLAESRFMTRLAQSLYRGALEVVREGGSLPGFSKERVAWEAQARLAHLNLWSGDYPQAEALVQALLKGTVPKDLPRDSGSAPAALYSLLGQVSTRLANYDQAIERFDRALAASTDDIVASEVLDHLSEVLFRRGDNAGGEGAARGALERLGDAINPALKASILRHLGQGAQARSSYDEALEYFQGAYGRYSEVSHIRGMAEVLGATAHVYELQDRTRESVEALEESLALREDVGDIEGTAATLLRLGLNQYMLGEGSQGIGYMERCLSLYRQLNNPQGIGRALNALGLLHHVRGAYGDALSTREEARLHQERLGDDFGRAMSLASLSILFLEVGDYGQAESRIREALALVGEEASPVRKARFYHILGMVALQTGRWSEAQEHLNRAEAFFRDVGASEALSGVLVGLAQERLGAGALDEARQYCEQALSIARTLGLPSILQAQVLRGRVLLKEDKLRIALIEPCLEEAHQIAARLNYADFLWQVFELKGRLGLREGRPMEACRYLSQGMEVVYACHQQLPPELKQAYLDDPRRQRLRVAMEMALKQASKGRGRPFSASPRRPMRLSSTPDKAT